MGKLQDWYVTTCVFLFLFQASQIHCTSQTHVLNRLHRWKRGFGSSGHLNAIRRLSVSSLQNISGVKQQGLKERDQIENLPGQPPVNVTQYGGYVTVDETAGRSLYYYFVEATKTNNSLPLVLWLNGGPGCSSLYGAFEEIGPFRIHSDGKTLYTNPYSWNKAANVLFLESPAGTGFSYSNTKSDLENQGDMKTAADNYVFLVKWLERFPEYKGREFYIAGESYAGHYIPQLAQTILAHNKNNNKTFINLRGILMGNPSLDDDADLTGGYAFLVNRAIISQETYDSLEENCRGINPNSTACIELSMKIEAVVGELSQYDIFAPKCLNAKLSNQSKECTTVLKSDPCREHYMASYFNLAEVQRSMHVAKVPYKWKLCSEAAVGWSQEDASASMLPILKELMSHKHLRVWVYSGDTDTVISVTGTMNSLKLMNLTVVKEWLPWFSEGQVGGYTEEYKDNFRFATVKGAGHEVPIYKPEPALTLFKQFLLNSPLPLTP